MLLIIVIEHFNIDIMLLWRIRSSCNYSRAIYITLLSPTPHSLTLGDGNCNALLNPIYELIGEAFVT
jgi:hypothetical protein